MKNADYMAMIEHTGRGHEALGFVLGFLLDRKPGSALEAVDDWRPVSPRSHPTGHL